MPPRRLKRSAASKKGRKSAIVAFSPSLSSSDADVDADSDEVPTPPTQLLRKSPQKKSKPPPNKKQKATQKVFDNHL
jgi:hypothetical protein